MAAGAPADGKWRRVSLGLLLAVLGCGDFRSPTELKHAQILAVRLSAPELHAGGQSLVEVLATDDTGTLRIGPPTEASLAPDPLGRPIALPPGFPPPVVRGDGSAGSPGSWQVRAPEQPEIEALAALFALPPQVPLAVPLRFTLLLDGRSLRADKAVLLLRSPDVRPVPNPVVRQILVDGRPADDGSDPAVRLGQDHILELQTEPTERPLSYAWYAAIGEISHYRSARAVLRAEAAGRGALLVVVRNDRGGVGWKAIDVNVNAAP